MIVYGDYECPFCAAFEARLSDFEVCFRHFPVKSAHPRAHAAACAAEAAALQGRFWEMHDALFADQGRLEDPHLWARAERLGLDVERFDADRRSDGRDRAREGRFPRRRARRRRHDPERVRDGVLYPGRAARSGVGFEAPPRGNPVPGWAAALGCRDRTGKWTGAYYTRLMPTDAQLLAKISSDATGEALRALYRSYAGELYGFALNALGDRGTAEEVVQEVFTRAWRHAEAYDPTRGSVRTWLYQIARHAIIDTRRRAAVRPALALHEPRDEQDPEGLSIERAMLGWQVASALEKLTPEHRQVIRLAHVQGLSVREIAERLGLPEGTVKSRTWYALRSLRLVLEEMGVRA